MIAEIREIEAAAATTAASATFFPQLASEPGLTWPDGVSAARDHALGRLNG
jgi:hypothetical protein